tara:strand:+ start:1158 stop:1544 length:387 start_codon:yes stop_codon:yes gene_type:complete
MAEIPIPEENSEKRSVLGLSSDWPQQVTEQIVSKVDEIRDKTTGPAIKISRSVVYGLTACFLLLLSIPFLILGISRGLIEVFDAWVVSDRSTAVWVVYLITGVLWLAVGLLFWRKRPKGAAQPKQRTN